MRPPAAVPGPVRVMRSFCSWESMRRIPATERVKFIPCNTCVMDRHSRPKDGIASRAYVPAMTNSNSGVATIPYRPRIARRPAAGLDAGDKVGDRLVEQPWLLLVHHVAGLGEHHQAGRRDPLLEKKARLQARIILVTDDNQARHRDLAEIGFEIIERGPLGLEASDRVARALGVVLGEHLVELIKATRV